MFCGRIPSNSSINGFDKTEKNGQNNLLFEIPRSQFYPRITHQMQCNIGELNTKS